jgi:hypothetical protein
MHIERDPGCFNHGHDFLRPFVNSYAHGLVMFDRIGSGQEQLSRIDLESKVNQRLRATGWNDRAETIVLDPELEVWIWSDSPHVEFCLGWEGHEPNLRSWLANQQLYDPKSTKPEDPKKATVQALREVGKPRSSSIYGQLVGNVSLRKCTDGAFQKFKDILSGWFPVEAV